MVTLGTRTPRSRKAAKRLHRNFVHDPEDDEDDGNISIVKIHDVGWQLPKVQPSSRKTPKLVTCLTNSSNRLLFSGLTVRIKSNGVYILVSQNS